MLTHASTRRYLATEPLGYRTVGSKIRVTTFVSVVIYSVCAPRICLD